MKYYVKILLTLLSCVLLPCFAVFTILNRTSSSLYEDMIANAQIDHLEVSSNINKMIIHDIEMQALQISLDSNVQKLSNLNFDNLFAPKGADLNTLTISSVLLSKYVQTNNLLESVYLYVDGTDYMISSRDSVVALSYFADIDWMDRYKELKLNRSADRILPSHIVKTGYDNDESYQNYGRPCVTYVYPITHFTSSFNGALVFNLHEDRFLKLFTANSPNSYLAILDRDGTWISGTRGIDYKPILEEYGWDKIFSEQAEKKGYFLSSAGEKPLLCSYYRLPEDGRNIFISIEDMSVLMQKRTAYQVTEISSILLLLFVATLIAFWCSRSLYSPIGNLAMELDKNNKLNINGSHDEISAISLAVNELLKEDRKLFVSLSREKMREATYWRILSGESYDIEDEGIRDILPYSRNISILAILEVTGQALQHDKIYDSRIRLFARLIQDVLTKDGFYSTAMRYEGDMVAVITSIDDIVDDLESSLYKKILIIQKEVRDALKHSATFAIGSLQDDFTGVRQSFDQAKQVLPYRFLRGFDSIILYDDVYIKSEYYNAANKIEHICHYLRASNKEETLKAICELITEMENKQNIDYSNATLILNRLLTELIQYAIDADVRLEEILGDDVMLYHQLWDNQTLQDTGNWLLKVFATAIDYQKATINTGNEHMRRALEYVKTNFSNNNITIEAIASNIGISYSHLRKVFKDATGRNLADYINELRIRKAKELMRGSRLTIKEISQQCGYSHERSFSRAFMQSENISPGKYRELIKNEKTLDDSD